MKISFLQIVFVFGLIFVLLNFHCFNPDYELDKNTIFRESPRLNEIDTSLSQRPSLSPLWMKPLDDSALVITFKPLSSGDQVLYSKSFSNVSPELISFNSNDGATNWRITDFTDSDVFIKPSNFYYFYGNHYLQMLPQEGYDYLIVDLVEGIIKSRSNYDFKAIHSGISGFNDYAILVTRSKGLSNIAYQIRKVNLTSNKNEHLFYVLKDISFKYDDVRAPEMIHKRGHDSLIVYAHNKWNNSPFETHNELVAYNLSKKKEQWRNFMSDGGIYVNRGRPIVLPDKMIVASDSVWCVEPYSGDILWSKKYTPGLSGMAHWNGRIIFGIEGWDARMIALDATTGSEIWNVPADGTGSNIEIFEDNIYYVGGGELHVLDAETGKEYYTMEAPFRENNSSLFFQTTLTIDPKKRLIFLCDYAHALCYSIE